MEKKIKISKKISNHLFLNGLNKSDMNDPNPKSNFLKNYKNINDFCTKREFLEALKKIKKEEKE